MQDNGNANGGDAGSPAAGGSERDGQLEYAMETPAGWGVLRTPTRQLTYPRAGHHAEHRGQWWCGAGAVLDDELRRATLARAAGQRHPG